MLIQLRPRVISLGGGVLLGFLFLMIALFVSAFFTSSDFGWWMACLGAASLLVFGYGVLSVSERLLFDGHTLVWTGWFRRERRVDLNGMTKISHRFQGFNLEEGMETIFVFDDRGREEIIPLGACWRFRDLQVFLQTVASSSGLIYE